MTEVSLRTLFNKYTKLMLYFLKIHLGELQKLNLNPETLHAPGIILNSHISYIVFYKSGNIAT
jgi:hypothetical protein